MSLIEQAAKRLEELRRAGAEIKEQPVPPPAAQPAPEPERVPTPEAAVRGLRNGDASLLARDAATSPAAFAPNGAGGAVTPPAAMHAAPAAVEVAPAPSPVPVAPAPAHAHAAPAPSPVQVTPAPSPVHVAPPPAPASAPPAAPGRTSHPGARGRGAQPPRPASPGRLEINLERLQSRGMMTPGAPRSQISDEFRVIKRPILSNASGRGGNRIRNGNLVMVTSALPGEGKTFTSVNLAISLAMEIDTTVLLVDGDVAHPDLPKQLGVTNSPGLLELLTRDDLDVSDVLVRTNIENLTILPAGAYQRRATELLASEQMAILLDELASRYADRIIVFDSPPLLATTEARVLATHMGQIVMVVAADSTRQQAVNLALSTIESCEVVMMVLNKADKTDVGTYYGYYGDEAGER